MEQELTPEILLEMGYTPQGKYKNLFQKTQEIRGGTTRCQVQVKLLQNGWANANATETDPENPGYPGFSGFNSTEGLGNKSQLEDWERFAFCLESPDEDTPEEKPATGPLNLPAHGNRLAALAHDLETAALENSENPELRKLLKTAAAVLGAHDEAENKHREIRRSNNEQTEQELTRLRAEVLRLQTGQ